MLSPTPTVPRPPNRTRARTRRATAGLVLLAAVTAVFLAVSLPRYLSLDPARSLSPPRPELPLYYPLLVTHIFLGALVLVTACLQVWPWLRRRHRAVHRVSGRVYVVAVLAAGPSVLVISPLASFGPNARVAATLMAVLWLATTVLGYRRARQRRFAEHREWMVRSVALSFAIVAQRPWGALCVAVFVPGPDSGVDPAAMHAAVGQAMGVSFWLCWLVNLAVAEWWLVVSRRAAPCGWARPPGRTPRWPARRP